VLMQTNQHCMNHFLCLSIQTSRNKSIQSSLQHIDMIIFITFIIIEIVKLQCIKKLSGYEIFLSNYPQLFAHTWFPSPCIFSIVFLIKKNPSMVHKMISTYNVIVCHSSLL
jgi:hypothetical protein